jgi:predicted patatin/cPLA2 family phospholipase
MVGVNQMWILENSKDLLEYIQSSSSLPEAKKSLKILKWYSGTKGQTTIYKAYT